MIIPANSFSGLSGASHAARAAVETPIDTNESGGAAAGVRAFAGVRWDPFIMDAPATLKTIATGQLEFTDPGSIFMDGKNVLSVVVELDCARYLPGAQLVGVISETLTRGSLNVRIGQDDRGILGTHFELATDHPRRDSLV